MPYSFFEVITHGGAAGSNNMETEVDQFAMTSSDHYKHAVAGGASSASHVTFISHSLTHSASPE